MSDKKNISDKRAERLKQNLRANLLKRKDQTRERTNDSAVAGGQPEAQLKSAVAGGQPEALTEKTVAMPDTSGHQKADQENEQTEE